MRYSRVKLTSICYELAPHVVTSEMLEDRLAPAYQALKIPRGQLEMITGIQERRYWDPGQTMADGAIRAGRKALNRCAIPKDQIEILIYAGVCRDGREPATACAVADGLGLGPHTQIFDVSNACLGVLNGIVQIANAIELGQVQAGLVVACESARGIVDQTIERLNAAPTMAAFRLSLATFTGGSAAIGVVVSEREIGETGHRLLGGVIGSAAEHHRLCRWRPDTGVLSAEPQFVETDAPAVLQHGVTLGGQTWRRFLAELDWTAEPPDRVICHQVGGGHREAILRAIEFPLDRDFPTFPYLGNIGTVSLPITAAIASERGFLEEGHRVGFLGIGSGLSCLMLGLEW